jgi:DNA-binding HxlR family transcriptional regulator
MCRSEETKPLRDFLSKVGDKWTILLLVTLARWPEHRARFSDRFDKHAR